MQPERSRKEYSLNFFDRALEGIIDMEHELVRLGELINWQRIEESLEGHYCKYGRKAIPTRLLVGLQMLRWMYNLSDEGACKLWVENPYFQYFCGEKLFQHKLPMDRSSMSRWRKRIGDEKLQEILEESIETAKRAGALKDKDMELVAVDTTVQEKAVDWPSEVKLVLDAIVDIGREARKSGLGLKQSYKFLARTLAIKASGYARARQMKRLARSKDQMHQYLSLLLRRVKQAAKKQVMLELPQKLLEKIERAKRVLMQTAETKDKLYVWHAPEVECIAKGKARSPYEFGCKVSLAINVNTSKAGHFILSSRALHGKPYDGHTLASTIADIETNTGVKIKRAYVDRGYKGHDYEDKLKVYKSGQKLGVFGRIKKELARRSAIEPIIGHAKSSHKMNRCRLKGSIGDKINAVFAAIAFNFKQILNFLGKSFYAFIQMLLILLGLLNFAK